MKSRPVFPNTPNGFVELLGLSVYHFFPVVQRTVWFSVLAVLLMDANIYWGGAFNEWLRSHAYWAAALNVLTIGLVVYVLSAMLYIVYQIWGGGSLPSYKEALAAVLPRLGKICLVLAFFVALPFLLLIASHALQTLLVRAGHDSPYVGLILLLLVSVVVTIVYLRYFYMIPLIAMENQSLKAAYRQAANLCADNWARMFGLYAYAVAVYLIASSHTLHGQLLKAHKLSLLLDLPVLILALPILMNLVVLLRHDLELRQSIEAADEEP